MYCAGNVHVVVAPAVFPCRENNAYQLLAFVAAYTCQVDLLDMTMILRQRPGADGTEDTLISIQAFFSSCIEVRALCCSKHDGSYIAHELGLFLCPRELKHPGHLPRGSIVWKGLVGEEEVLRGSYAARSKEYGHDGRLFIFSTDMVRGTAKPFGAPQVTHKRQLDKHPAEWPLNPLHGRIQVFTNLFSVSNSPAHQAIQLDTKVH